MCERTAGQKKYPERSGRQENGAAGSRDNSIIHENRSIRAAEYAGIRLAALDLDQTTLRTDKSLSPLTREMLTAAAEAGICLAAASGRSFGSLPEEVAHFPGIEYAITSNGAAVYRMSTGERCRECLLTPESVEGMLDALPECMAWEAFIDGVPYGWKTYIDRAVEYGVGERGAAYIRATRKPVEDIRGFLREHRGELDSVDVIVRDAEENRRVREILTDAVPGIYITSSAPQLLEISRADSGKHSALRWLCGELGIAPAETVAFGDAENDREMILFAGIGAAMANGTEAVKRSADLVTAGNNEDGVAIVLQRILQAKAMQSVSDEKCMAEEGNAAEV